MNFKDIIHPRFSEGGSWLSQLIGIGGSLEKLSLLFSVSLRWINQKTKMLRIMKLTAIILFLACLTTSAKSYSQRVTLSLKHVPVQKVFKEVFRQTGVSTIYNEAIFKDFSVVTIKVKNATVQEVIDKCLRDQLFTYSIEGNMIVIKPKPATGFEPVVAFPSAKDTLITLTGKVTDASGKPVIGATVLVRGTKTGTTTDAFGNFSLNAEPGQTLVISSVEFEKKEIKISNETNIVIGLHRAVSSLNEVVVNKGYYSTTQRLNTGSVSRIGSGEIEKQPVLDPMAAIQGRMTGVYISQSSGTPGSSFSIQIRGRNSLRTAANNPLYIIDGVPFTATSLATGPGSNIIVNGSPFIAIDPVSIETIEILKDADATSIYGSRGANGVVLITTKKGMTGKTRVDVSFKHGIGKVNTKMKLLDSDQYQEMRQEAFANDGVTPRASDYDVNGTWDKNRYTDWQKVLVGGTSSMQNARVSISGGNAGTRFLIGGGFDRQTTVFPGDFSYKRGSLNFNVSHGSLNNKFSVSLSGNFSKDANNLPAADLMTRALQLPPNAPALYDENGDLNWENSTWSNPLAALYSNYEASAHNIILNSVIRYKASKNFSLSLRGGYTFMSMEELRAETIKSTDPNLINITGRGRFGDSELNTWIIEPQIEYRKKFGRGQLNILAGTTFQEDKSGKHHIIGLGYTSDAMIGNISAASSLLINSASQTTYRYNAGYGRLNYNYDDKYLVNLTGRIDGSTRFGPGKQFASFGAIGAAWIFSEEPIISIPWLSLGKIRGSYGISGSDQIADYGFLNSYIVTTPYQSSTSVIPARLANDDYAWEANRKLELGIELSFLNNTLHFSSSWYSNRTDNQLVGYPLSDITGFPSVQYNFPAKVRNTGWEFVIEASNIKLGNVFWNSSFNLTIPENKLLSYPGIETSSYANTYEVGKSLFMTKQYAYTGVDPQSGIYTFEDVDKNGILNSSDLQALKMVGQNMFGGFRNSFRYKQFELDIFFQFVDQNARNFLRYGEFSFAGRMSNQPEWVMNRWQKEGDVTDIQKFTQSLTSEARGAYSIANSSGENNISDASFLRFKTVSFAWSVPSKWLENTSLQSSSLFIEGVNLLTFTGFRGLEPENSNAALIPPLRVLSIGARLSL